MSLCYCTNGVQIISAVILVQDVDIQLFISSMFCNLWAVLYYLCIYLRLGRSRPSLEVNLGSKKHQDGIYRSLQGFKYIKLVMFPPNKSPLLICYGVSIKERSKIIFNLISVFSLCYL